MEFPDVGENCAVRTCRTLDFLPVRCSACQQVFCKDHYCFECHSCPVGNSRERQVPVCPLCGVPVPTGPNESADIKVGQHIDTACRSQPALALKGKIFNNTCSVAHCKKKELVPFRCEQCHLNFCVRHRNEMDHDCKGPTTSNSGGRRMTASGLAAIKRAIFKQPQPSNHNRNNLNQGSGSTINRQQPIVTGQTARDIQEEEDRQLALALAASLAAEHEEVVNRRHRQVSTNRQQQSNNCNIS